jgi:hypothetical protein
MFERFNVELPIKFVYSEERKEGTGRMLDISAGGGGLIVTNEELRSHMHLEMWLFIPDGKDPLKLNGEVVWTNRIESNLCRAGVKFDKVDFMGISRILRLKE